MLELESSISWNIRNFFQGRFFFILGGLGWEMQGSISGNIRSRFILELESSIFGNIRNFFSGGFFLFLGT